MPPGTEIFGWVVAGITILYLAIDRVRAWRRDDSDHAVKMRDEWIAKMQERMKTIETEQDSQRSSLITSQAEHKLAIKAHFDCEQRSREQEERSRREAAEQEERCNQRIAAVEAKLAEHIQHGLP